MDIHPKYIESHTVSEAERIVFKYVKMARQPGDYCAFHSLMLPGHRNNLTGETDFLILTPEGFIILEVKGGIISVNKNGEWFTETKGGNIHKIKQNPFLQAKNNMYSVQDEMIKASMPFRKHSNLMGFGVIFPECKFKIESIEIERSTLLDVTGFINNDCIGNFIKQLEIYWRAKFRYKPVAFDSSDFKRIRHWLRPKFHGVKSLRAEQSELSETMVSLVDEQMDFLEISSGKTRVICRGGAGTGKTLLGLEYTRLRRAKGLKVLFVVPSQMFFRYLVNRGYRESWIITFEETGKIENHSLDMVVIDESQDLMSLKNFQKIDKILKGGISRGSWLILIDDQNQTGIDGKFDSDYYTRLKSFSEIDFLLPRNIRNTKEIIDVTKLLTSRDIGKKGTGLGSVRFIKYKNANEMGVNVCAYIKDQRIKDLKDDMIVILGKDDIGLSAVAREIKRNGHTVTELNRNNIAGYPLDSIMYSSIKDFKGIEAFIIIVDIGEFPTEEALASTLLYVAVTRATGHLILLYPESMKEIIAETEYKNRNKL